MRLLKILLMIGIPGGLLVFRFILPNHFKTIFHHIPSIILNVVCDVAVWFYHKNYHLYTKIGRVWAYCGAFGRGKTLAMVHDARMIYKRFNNKIVFWKGEFRPQVVRIYSNVAINDVPYTRLNSLMDIVDVAQKQPKFDDLKHIHTVSIFCIDELSSLLNSRQFATNLNFDVIASLLQCRKSSSKLLYTAQNFVEVDALIRRNTHYIVDCRKRWRFMFGMVFDAKDVEYALNPNLCNPIADYGWFVRNSDYKAYDTLSQAMAVDKNKISQDFITTEQAYARYAPLEGTLDNCAKLNKRGKKRLKQKSA